MKKSNTAIYIPNMDADNFEKICNENGLKFIYVKVPPHGRLIDADALKDKWIWGDTDRLGHTEVIEVIDIDNAPTIIESEV